MKLLIVDDEAHIRKGLQMGVLWDTCGISEVKTASNGYEALDIIKTDRPDILLTDIRMPGIDGLDLISAATAINKSLKVVVFSGFSDFDYARQSISLGVKAYLLKPVKIVELKAVVCDLVAELKEEEQLRKRALQEAREHELTQQLLNDPPDMDVMQSLLADFQFPDEHVFCVLFESDSREEYKSKTVQNVIRKMIASISGAESHTFNVRQQVLWLQKVGGMSRWDLQNRLEKELLEYKKKEDWDRISLSVSISGVYRVCELSTAWRECRELLNRRLYLGKGQIILKEREKKQGKQMYHIEHADVLRQNILNFEQDAARAFIENIFLELKEREVTSYALVKNLCLQMQQILFLAIDEIGVDLENVLEKQDRTKLVVPDYVTLEEYCFWIVKQYMTTLQELQSWGKLPVSNTIRKAVAYIQTHYHESISVDFLSSYVGASRTYFSHKFKKEMLMSFTDYLNQIRIEKACRLLKTTLDTADEVGRKVGFQDGRYFSTVFKKIVGCSPSSYRKNGTA